MPTKVPQNKSLTKFTTRMSDNTAQLTIEDKTYELPIVEGSEQEKAVDISKLRSQSGYITLDPGFKNTGSTTSSITFLDGEEGVLRYRAILLKSSRPSRRFCEPPIC